MRLPATTSSRTARRQRSTTATTTSIIALTITASLLTVRPAVASSTPTPTANTTTTGTTTAGTTTGTAPTPINKLTRLGLYAGPATKTTQAVAPFEQWSGLPVTNVLDFPPEAAWTGHTGITGPSWLLEAHQGKKQQLEYSLPMFPALPGHSLANCAAGKYDTYWAQTGRNLVRYGQGAATIRPGWEFNASWYRWSAVNKVSSYIGCFQRIVTTMRATPASTFRFDWNPNLGSSPFPAEQAYPGDSYVDYVGVDVYDTSWTWYPTPANVTTTTAQENAWKWILKGDHGLLFWRDFAAAHRKPLAIPEWGLTVRTDGRGGGDNPVFVNAMLDFIADPANNVAYQHYFNIDDAGASKIQHHITRPGHPFPLASAAFQSRTRGGVTTGTSPVVTPPSPRRLVPVKAQLCRPGGLISQPNPSLVTAAQNPARQQPQNSATAKLTVTAEPTRSRTTC